MTRNLLPDHLPHLKQNMATRCDSSGISFQTQCLHGPLSAVSVPDSSGIVCQFQSQLEEICPFVPLKPATEKTPFLFTPLARAMSENVANNSHESNAEKLRRSSLALRGKRCYQRSMIKYTRQIRKKRSRQIRSTNHERDTILI